MMTLDSQALVHLPGVPESLGNFRLNDHNVVEWSDPDIPGVRHKGRKETGKWINPVNSADIQYQKTEDCKQSTRGKEQSRTEVIQGQAPDSQFSIVRSQKHFTGDGVDKDSRSSRVQSSSTSYQMSSSRGVRSTTKSTSNRTTTKTVSAGGGRSDDFEHLGLSFQPLDTSTQRERLNVSRSGTLGLRRPPTRRHTPATPAITSTSPDDSEMEVKDETIVASDSDDNLLNTPPSRSPPKGIRDISKFRVGFPVEIQLELQNRLRGSHFERSDSETEEINLFPRRDLKENAPSPVTLSSNKDQFSNKLQPWQRQIDEDSSTNFYDMRKSEELESFDSHEESRVSRRLDFVSRYLNPFPYKSNNVRETMKSPTNIITEIESEQPGRRPSPTGPWEKELLEGSKNDESSDELFRSFSPNFTEKSLYTPEPYTTIPIVVEKTSEKQPSLSNRHHILNHYPNDGYAGGGNFIDFSGKKSPLFQSEETENSNNYKLPRNQGHSTTPMQSSPSLERSRKLLEMINETPSIFQKMSLSAKSRDDQKNYWNEFQSKSDWQTQRQLSFLNDSLTRIFDGEGDNSKPNLLEDTETRQSESKDLYDSSFDETMDDLNETDMNGNLRMSRPGQVSQTWITSNDFEKPSQKVFSEGVTTSIAAANDPLRRGPKKVEFCKTEVHFTADSGRFQIVETDENKPSTSHLFRRKKRDRSRQSILPVDKDSTNNEEVHQNEGKNCIDSSIASTETNVDTSETMASTIWEFCKPEKSENLKISSPISSPGQSPEFKESRGSKLLEVTMNESAFQSNEGLTSSQNGFPEFEEMKIQRYLSQLKPFSTSAGAQEVWDYDRNAETPTSYKFNNVLYENGSFVPLATRRSLIEMNTISKDSENLVSQLNEEKNSSSRYSMPSDISQTPARLARMEATVATARPNPQITSVELRYEFENDGLEGEGTKGRQKTGSHYSSPSDLYHSLDMNKREHTPDPYSSRSQRIADLIKRSYYRNPNPDWTADSLPKPIVNDLPMSASIISSTSENKNASKSIITIGTYDVFPIRFPTPEKPDPSPEPMLSMDHTWKGPAFNQSRSPRSLEPEWVSKARSRENRITDWDAIGKQRGQNESTVSDQQPPWIGDLKRFRNKSVSKDTEEPNVSIVYPWQRPADQIFPNDKPPPDDNSLLISIIPTPVFPSNNELSGKDKSTHRKVLRPQSPPELPILQSVSKNKNLNRDQSTVLTSSNSANTELKVHRKKTIAGGSHAHAHANSLSSPPSSGLTSPVNISLPERPTKMRSNKTGPTTASPSEANTVHAKIPLLSQTKDTSSKGPPSFRDGGSGSRSRSIRGDAKSTRSTDSSALRDNASRRMLDKDLSGASSRSTPIHRHPTVVSKLPVRKTQPQREKQTTQTKSRSQKESPLVTGGEKSVTVKKKPAIITGTNTKSSDRQSPILIPTKTQCQKRRK